MSFVDVVPRALDDGLLLVLAAMALDKIVCLQLDYELPFDYSVVANYPSLGVSQR